MVIFMLIVAFKIAKPIIEEIEKHGQQAFYVGGCVRDLLLNRSIGDIDIATSASPVLIQQIFPKVIPVGIEHGTVIVRHKHESYEVTTFRIDGAYSDKRHPDSVEFIDKIDKDLQRRDFTINALAMDKNGHITDLFDGKSDLENKVIRTVGNGYDRFMEDPLRIIRALRFTSQLGFTIGHETLADMIEVKHTVETLAVERIANELTKLFAGNYLNNGIEYFKITEVSKHLPIFKDLPEMIYRLPKTLIPLATFGEVIALFHIIEPSLSIAKWVREWKCSNKTKQEAIQLIKAFNDYKENGLQRWTIYQLSDSYYNGFIRLINTMYPHEMLTENYLDQISIQLPIQSKKELAINGNDLIELFPSAKKGRWLQTTINRIEREIVLGSIRNTKYDIKEWIKWNPPEIN